LKESKDVGISLLWGNALAKSEEYEYFHGNWKRPDALEKLLMEAWETYLTEHRERFLRELSEFLSIPSISSLPDRIPDVRRAAAWVTDRLKAAGIQKVSIEETGGHPVVYGQWLKAPGHPTVLVYGHFDVQPVDPVELWTHPPFEPVMKEGRIYARGASDDKGNMLLPILAAEALLKTSGAVPVNLKFFFEGQEEIGSPDLPTYIASHEDLLACDFVLSADGGQLGEDQPSLVVSRRGICALQIDVNTANSDVHSGTYGGTFMNPIHALAGILSSLHDAKGRIQVDGFYDQVAELTTEQRAQIADLPFDHDAYFGRIGVKQPYGETGYTTCERAWIRPTLEVNGIWGGFQGDGIKTVIPSQAHAKVTCRLVADQDPEDILDKVIAQVLRLSPPGIDVRAYPLEGAALPFAMEADHPGNLAAGRVLSTLYGKKPYVARMGGTVPVSGMFLKHLGQPMINFAFGLSDENIHAPDEFFRLSSFERGQRAYCMIFAELATEQD
jgi:acetylornithine deacetylase/succinyl-diaminopimelate desuccinylase-like protein